MKKRVWMLTIAAAAVLALGGCSGSGDSQEAQSGAAETTSQAKESDSQETSGGSGETSGEAAQEEAESTGGTLIVGFDQEFPPMGFMAEDGSYVGFDLDLAQEAASRLGLEYQAQPIAWDSKDMELESGNIDCIWNGFTITGREDDYEWTEPYMDNAQVFVVNGDSGIETLADLAGKVVECQADSSALAALNEDAELTATFAQLLTTADYNSALMDLEQGAVDAVAMDVVVARYQIQQRDANFVVLDETLSSEAYAVGFKKGNTELRDQVQGALEEMAADGTMAEISEKWFGEDLTVIGK
ncbi:MAG: amino acid ABC transporter substrate-binding protein [Lachnospiraceae bacterium]|nr:amino acid ABC transporter substrate-binding protein [Lachnospiraceae bacterium]